MPGTLRAPAQAAIEAVARHFSTGWDQGEGPPDAYFTVAGKRIAADVVVVAPRVPPAKPRLRFDKVALRLLSDLRAALQDAMPEGRTLIVTVTAPIRLPGKTAAALTQAVRGRLSRHAGRLELREDIHGNGVQARLAMGGWAGAARLAGFVHNPEADPAILLDGAQALLEGIARAIAGRPAETRAAERWLLIAEEGGPATVEAHRSLLGQLGSPPQFKTVLTALPGGRIETLAG